jgi:hypothetical protein
LPIVCSAVRPTSQPQLLPTKFHLGIHGRRPWRRLSRVVLSRIGLAVGLAPEIGRFFLCS